MEEINVKGEYAIFNSHLLDRYKRLERRALFLRKRIFEEERLGKNSHDRSELSALEWAMRIVMQYYKEHPGQDDHLKPCEHCKDGYTEHGYTCEVCEGKGVLVILSKYRPKIDTGV